MIEVENSLKGLVRTLNNIQRQVPFAASRALNRVALKVQDFELGTELHKIKRRGTWARKGTRFGVNVNFARKDNIQSQVFSRAPWLDFQERGGTKKPSGKMLLMPVTGGARPTEDSPFKKNLKPSRSNSKVVFIAKKKGFFQVVGRGQKKQLKLLWSFTRGSANVRKRIDFEKNGASIARQEIPVEFNRAYDEAMQSALKEQASSAGLL